MTNKIILAIAIFLLNREGKVYNRFRVLLGEILENE
jgi:hypothetical protein